MSEHRATSQHNAAPAPVTSPGAPRRPYARPAVVKATKLETRAGSPIPPQNLIFEEPINKPNDYGL